MTLKLRVKPEHKLTTGIGPLLDGKSTYKWTATTTATPQLSSKLICGRLFYGVIVCILVMMVSMSVFWSLLASSITALGHFLLQQLGLRCRLKCDSSICIPTLRALNPLCCAVSQFRLCTYSSISFPTLHCSSHSSTHGIVYPSLPGCDSSIEILHCLHMIRQVQ